MVTKQKKSGFFFLLFDRSTTSVRGCGGCPHETYSDKSSDDSSGRMIIIYDTVYIYKDTSPILAVPHY